MWRLILMGNNLQDAGSDTAICILLLAKSSKITERNAGRTVEEGRSGGELFAGSRERQRKWETHTQETLAERNRSKTVLPLFARRRGCHRRNISEPEI